MMCSTVAIECFSVALYYKGGPNYVQLKTLWCRKRDYYAFKFCIFAAHLRKVFLNSMWAWLNRPNLQQSA